ncbi:MAG: hypothetical protein ACUVX8_15590 [Candidatus Zipacnadales bacterium]
MAPTTLAAGLGIVVVQTYLLFLLSRRLLLGYILRSLATSGRGRRYCTLISLLRWPGNLLHEASHAAAYLLSGYTIRHFATCLRDPEERGYVETGPPWSPLHWPPLSAALSTAAPVLAGALAIRTLATALGLGLPTTDLTSDTLGSAVVHLFAHAYTFLRSLNWTAWQTYLFWYLTFSIGAELAPSPSDLRQGCLMLCLLLLLLLLTIYAIPHMELRPDRATLLYGGIQWLLSTLSVALVAAIISCGLVGLVAGGLVWTMRHLTDGLKPPGHDRSRRPSPRSPLPSDRRGSVSYRK